MFYLISESNFCSQDTKTNSAWDLLTKAALGIEC